MKLTHKIDQNFVSLDLHGESMVTRVVIRRTYRGLRKSGMNRLTSKFYIRAILIAGNSCRYGSMSNVFLDPTEKNVK